jgi:hypothetical protein
MLPSYTPLLFQLLKLILAEWFFTYTILHLETVRTDKCLTDLHNPTCKIMQAR